MCVDECGQKAKNQDGEDEEKHHAEHSKKIFYTTRDVYITHRYDQSILKDKHLLTLSAAALGLSITYIEKVVTISEATGLLLLVFSWIFFGLSLISILFSYHLSIPCYDHYITEMDKKFVAGEDFQDIRSDLTKKIDQWNSCAFWTFLFGLVLFMSFVIVNLCVKAHV